MFTFPRYLTLTLLFLFIAVPIRSQKVTQVSSPMLTCDAIPSPVTNAVEIEQAIERANDETLCPGADTIDLGGNVIFSGNAAYGDFDLPAVQHTLTIQNGTFDIDSPDVLDRLGLVTIASGANLTLDAITVKNAGSPVLGYRSPAIVNQGTLTIRDSTLTQNFRVIENNGTFYSYSSRLNSNSDWLIDGGTNYFIDSEIRDNRTFYEYRQGLPLIRSNHTVIVNSHIGGTAAYPGQMLSISGHALLANNLIIDNDSGAFANYSGDDLTMVNNTFHNNTFSTFAYDLTTFANNALWENTIETFNEGSGAVISHNAADVALPNSTNTIALSADPFAAASVNYYPDDNSPLIDAGDESFLPPDEGDIDADGNTNEPLPLDKDGNARVRSTTVDIGAYEADPSSEQFATIRGTVISKYYAQPLSDILVVIEGTPYSTRTDANGAYAFEGVPIGESYIVRAGDIPAAYQWWQEADTRDSATPLSVDTDPVTDVDFGVIPVPANGEELVTNANFGYGERHWRFYGDIVHTIWGSTDKKLIFHREFPGWRGATVFQLIEQGYPAGVPLRLLASVGNNSDVPKRVEFMVRDPEWDDVITCMVTIPPNTTPQRANLDIIGKPEMEWSGIFVAIRVLDRDGKQGIVLDRIGVSRVPAYRSIGCGGYPGFPPPEDTNLIYAGDFNGNWSQGWKLWGDVQFTVENGVMQLSRPTGAVRPAVLFSDIAHHFSSEQTLALTLELGNNSTVSKEVEVVLRDFEWKQNFTCTYTIPPNTPLTPVTLQGVTSTAWGHPMLLVRSENTDGNAGILVDNADLKIQPHLTVSDQCSNPVFSSIDQSVPDDMKAPPEILPDGGIIPDTDGAAPAPVAPPNPGGIPEIPGF